MEIRGGVLVELCNPAAKSLVAVSRCSDDVLCTPSC